MAMEKEIDYFGVKAKYWKIIESQNNYVTNQTRGMLGLYLNKEARTESAGNILKRIPFQVNGTDLTREALYAQIKLSKKDKIGKETNIFADAVDC